MPSMAQATPVDCQLCVTTSGKRKTGRAIPTVVPNGAGAPIQVNVMRCIICDVTKCQTPGCSFVSIAVNVKRCPDCGRKLMPERKR